MKGSKYQPLLKVSASLRATSTLAEIELLINDTLPASWTSVLGGTVTRRTTSFSLDETGYLVENLTSTKSCYCKQSNRYTVQRVDGRVSGMLT